MEFNEIHGGATLWARQTIDSEIFYNKPDKWFKIWFFLVNRVNFKDDARFKRGEIFLKYEWICDSTKANKNQIDSFLRWAKSQKMITTVKSTRGMIVKITKYNDFQKLENYKTTNKKLADTETETETAEKAQKQRVKSKKKYFKPTQEPNQNRDRTDTILKNDNNDKNIKYNISSEEPKRNDMESISTLLKMPVRKKATTYQWQEKALNAIEQLKGADKKRSSIFKCFKENEKNSEFALNDCRELGQMHVLYFLKVYSEIKKRQK